MDSKTIIDLPVEILFQIIKQVPNKNQFSLTCKKFYETVWRFDLSYRLRLNHRDLVIKQRQIKKKILQIFFQGPVNTEKFLFVLESTREVKNVSIELHKNHPLYQEKLEKVLNKFCENISELKVSLPSKSYEIGEREFARMITRQNRDESGIMTSLNKLKMLHLSCADENLIEMFTKIPTNSLENVKLFYNNSCVSVIKKLFSNQQNIKKLEIKSQFQKNLNSAVDHAENTSRETEQDIFQSLLNLTKLTHLNLNQITVDDEMLQNINTKLVNLRSLAAIFDCEFKLANFFNNLTEISFHRNTSETSICDFCKLDNRKIESLKIEIYPELEPQTLAAIARSFKNLKTLNIYQSLGRNSEVFSFMSNFNNLESFYLTSSLSKLDENFSFLMQNTTVNKKLKSLVIRPNFPNYPCSLKMIKKIVTNFPNLEKVFIRPESIDDEANPLMVLRQLRVMLKGWRNLTHLTLNNGGEDLINEDLDLILDHGQNLKFIEIGEFVSENEEEVRKIFEQKFGIIKFGDYRGFLMADHETLKHKEELGDILSHSLM